MLEIHYFPPTRVKRKRGEGTLPFSLVLVAHLGHILFLRLRSSPWASLGQVRKVSNEKTVGQVEKLLAHFQKHY